MTKSNGSGHKRGRKRKNVWSISGLKERVTALIHDGLLTKKQGEDEILKTIIAEFGEQMAADGLKLSKFALKTRVGQLVWTRRLKDELWNAHRDNLVDTFRTVHAWIPARMIDSELRVLKGVTHTKSMAEFKAGMGVLNDDEMPPDAGKYEFPDNSYRKPWVVSDKPEGLLYIINSPLVGITYPDIKRNTLRRALADARKSDADAVVLTNLIDLWTKKTAGFLAVYRAMVSGIQINPKRFPADYRKEVRGILSGKITDKTIYQTLNERFLEILDGLHKIFHRKDEQGAEFPGPVFIQLCLKEEELIHAGAYYRLRYMSIVEQNRIEGELNIASNQLAEARKDRNNAAIKHWSKEVARLGARKARAIFTNHAGPEYRRYARRIRAWVVKKLQDVIPNGTVISLGSAYYKASRFIVKTHVPRHDKVTDQHLTNAGNNYGADVKRDTLADLTVECAPCAINFRDVGREDSRRDADGTHVPVTKYLCVAPSCLEPEFLRDELKDTLKEAHPVQELINDSTFQPGVLVVRWDNNILSYYRMPIQKLDDWDPVRNSAHPGPDGRYIIWLRDTDNHFGAPDKRHIWDPQQRLHHGVTEAFFEFLRRLGVVNPKDIGIHCTAEMDDATQGDLWFKQRYRPDPNLISLLHFTRWHNQMTRDIQRAAEKGNTKDVAQLTEELTKISIGQLLLKGEDFPFHQMMQVFDRHIDPQADVYSAILGNFVRSRLVIRGISKLQGELGDTRDLAAINFPEGNHRIVTLEGADLEGDYMALRLQDRIALRPEWQKFFKDNPDKADFLKEMIRAPRFGNATFGWGTIGLPGSFTYGVRIHGSPARQNSWSDIVDASIKSDLARGDDSYALMKYFTVTFYGDKHFYANAEVETDCYSMCAAGVHTSSYGSTGGFPANNTGVDLFCMPEGGPKDGPFKVLRFSHDMLRDWFRKPWDFDWKKHIPKPV
ncbi:MAG TPA: hypothetical protein VMJ72_02945 [Candidatus Paceibacterota bacterium]|nr:hypothetical protein [Candidatus Paceibacterota bacterium]